MIKGLITCVMLHLSNIYTKVYGEVYSGHYNIESEYFEPNFYEKYLYLFPSFVNHFYAGLFYPNYMYQKNNLIIVFSNYFLWMWSMFFNFIL